MPSLHWRCLSHAKPSGSTSSTSIAEAAPVLTPTSGQPVGSSPIAASWKPLDVSGFLFAAQGKIGSVLRLIILGALAAARARPASSPALSNRGGLVGLQVV